MGDPLVWNGSSTGRKPQGDEGCNASYLVRTPQRRASAPTPQMGLFQQPVKADRSGENPDIHPREQSNREMLSVFVSTLGVGILQIDRENHGGQ